jgi:hypothetical protein
MFVSAPALGGIPTFAEIHALDANVFLQIFTDHIDIS